MPDATDKLSLFNAAASAAAQYVATERTTPVAPPPEAVDALDAFRAVSLDEPMAPADAIEMLHRLGSPAAMRSTGGRYFGFVNGGALPAALAASVIASAWDQNVALPVMSPVGAVLDEVASRLVIDVLDLPTASTAAFCAGATVANLTAVITARDALLARVGWDCGSRGLGGAPQIDVIASEEVHISALKTLRLAGLGTDSVHFVPTDDCGRMRADALPETSGPTLVLMQAGNVNTGHSDPFTDVIGQLDRERSWIHVDGAFGLWAHAAPERRATVSGVDLADSWATDAHKWLNVPYDCGVVICADAAHLENAMRMSAAYVETDATRSPMHLGIQMSQAARAVPVWAALATLGRAGVAAMVERCCLAAEQFAARMVSARATVLSPVAINQVLVAFGDDETTDAVVNGVQRGGVAWMGATTWHGRRAMRVSVSDATTTPDDIEIAADAVLDTWHALG